jgi:hypothetical protein
MGTQWKKAQKAMLGNPVDFTDVLDGKAVALSGIVAPTNLTPARARAPRDGQVDYVVADVSPPITSGVLSVAVYNNGTLLASGQLTSTQPYLERMMHHQSSNAGAPKTIASGSFTHVEYAISTKVGEDGQVSRALNARVGLRYRD